MAQKKSQAEAVSATRKSALGARRALPESYRNDASRIIADRIVRSNEFRSSKTLCIYLPMHDEVDPSAVVARAWRARKRVFAPVTDNNFGMSFRELEPDTRMERNQYGIWEPIAGNEIAPKQIDLVVTPLVAFDDEHQRIGMGGGYFDRAFSFLRHRQHWLRPKLVGVAFDCQKVEKIEPNPWDIRLYRIVTELN